MACIRTTNGIRQYQQLPEADGAGWRDLLHQLPAGEWAVRAGVCVCVWKYEQMCGGGQYEQVWEGAVRAGGGEQYEQVGGGGQYELQGHGQRAGREGSPRREEPAESC